jgi:pimeloyl-ACP methyl ester carboxylesterase
VNPGGPGGATRGLIAEGLQEPESRFNKNVMEMYDLIGLDPRGVGTSTPVKCNPKIFNRRVQTLINSTKTYEAAKRYGQDLGESCASLTGPLIDHLDTIHVAKDHEVVRRALGAEQFDFLGLSYGSMIGPTYLELFPNEAGRMVFDGIVDHSQSEISTLFSEATTFEATLNQFFKWCDSQDDCALKAGINDTKVVFGQITRNASLSPLPAPACNNACQPNVTFEDLMIAVQSSLVSFPEGWVDLATSLAMAARGNASAISASLMTSETPDPDGFSPYASIAIGCQDWKHSGTTEQDLIQRLEAVKPFVPITKGVTQSWYYQSMCIGWPTNTTFPQQPLDRVMVETAPPVLLVNSVFDPECSIVWANGVREQLPTAVSITRNGTGHTSHVMLGDTRDAIDAFFATGKLPRDGSIYQS